MAKANQVSVDINATIAGYKAMRTDHNFMRVAEAFKSFNHAKEAPDA